MVFKVGDIDYSDKVLMDTYDVNQIDVYKAWEDANVTIHRSSYRKKVEGTFEMLISNISEYQAFLSDIQSNKKSTGAVPCKLAVNNLNQDNYASDFYVDYTMIRTMNSNYTKGYLSFTVTIEER